MAAAPAAGAGASGAADISLANPLHRGMSGKMAVGSPGFKNTVELTLEGIPTGDELAALIAPPAVRPGDVLGGAMSFHHKFAQNTTEVWKGGDLVRWDRTTAFPFQWEVADAAGNVLGITEEVGKMRVRQKCHAVVIAAITKSSAAASLEHEHTFTISGPTPGSATHAPLFKIYFRAETYEAGELHPWIHGWPTAVAVKRGDGSDFGELKWQDHSLCGGSKLPKNVYLAAQTTDKDVRFTLRVKKEPSCWDVTSKAMKDTCGALSYLLCLPCWLGYGCYQCLTCACCKGFNMVRKTTVFPRAHRMELPVYGPPSDTSNTPVAKIICIGTLGHEDHLLPDYRVHIDFPDGVSQDDAALLMALAMHINYRSWFVNDFYKTSEVVDPHQFAILKPTRCCPCSS